MTRTDAETSIAGAGASTQTHDAMRLPAWLATMATIAGAVLITSGFFLPWMAGSGPFGERTFSGADFARLVRMFEITSDSETSLAQLRGTAIAMYLVPALALNAAVMHICAPFTGVGARFLRWCAGSAGGYALGVLLLLLFLSIVPINDFAGVVGLPRAGFALTAAGAAVLLAAARR